MYCLVIIYQSFAYSLDSSKLALHSFFSASKEAAVALVSIVVAALHHIYSMFSLFPHSGLTGPLLIVRITLFDTNETKHSINGPEEPLAKEHDSPSSRLS